MRTHTQTHTHARMQTQRRTWTSLKYATHRVNTGECFFARLLRRLVWRAASLNAAAPAGLPSQRLTAVHAVVHAVVHTAVHAF